MDQYKQYPYSLEFWNKAWQQARENSLLKTTQEVKPLSWNEFYNKVSDIWLDMHGSRRSIGKSVTALFTAEGIVGEGSSVLDLGCGSGMLSIPMAENGINVTALDQSEGMLAALESEARRRSLGNIDIHLSSWTEYPHFRKHDLVIAAFFPPALDPQGLQCLEKWTKGYCSLVLRAGEDTFAIRRELWQKIMEKPLPSRDYQIPCLLNYLLASGRKPNLKYISWPESLSLPLESVIRYYKSYFAIFLPKDAAVEKTIRKVLENMTYEGKVEASGRVNIAIIWWEKDVVS